MVYNGDFTPVSDVTHRFSQNNLHICLNDKFGPSQANAVIDLLRINHMNCKRIFIDVRQVRQSTPAAVNSLKESLILGGFATEQVVFKGKDGFSMAVDGNRVLIQQEKKHVCKGNCANCKCGHGKKKHTHHQGHEHHHGHEHHN